MDIVFATTNKKKMEEIREIMKDTKFNIISMEDAGIDIEVVEDGETFEENSLKKAVEIMNICNKVVLADDSGLEIDFLDKAPGVYSARYLGKDTPYSIKNKIILEKLEGVPKDKRTARFVCVIAVSIPNTIIPKQENQFTKRATLEGIISHEIKGEKGFGYDPILYVEEYGMTTAEMTMELKNEISHRGKALRDMKDLLMEIFRGV